MPQTPYFGIRYPELCDVVTDQHIQDFLDDMCRAFEQTNAMVSLVQNRPAARIANLSASAQNFTQNVQALVTFADEVIDNDAMVDLGSSSTRITVQTPGLYLVAGLGKDGSGFTTFTSLQMQLFQNGVASSYRDKDRATGLPEPAVSGLLSADVGDYFELGLRWTGTGGPMTNFQTTLSAFLVSSRGQL